MTTFDQWKKQVIQPFKAAKTVWMVPGNDWLYSRWEAGFEASIVIQWIKDKHNVAKPR